mmetsp:Transcript_37538/g.120446  ORF Transcript_37538/g.120446 Transcript_37538/m.120446 type:complete len:263 (+) Transcript_37538:96-884(+)
MFERPPLPEALARRLQEVSELSAELLDCDSNNFESSSSVGDFGGDGEYEDSFAELGDAYFSKTLTLPLLEVTRVVEATFEMFLDDLCERYGFDGKRFRTFLVRRVATMDASRFDPEQWVARYCRFEALRRPGKVCYFVIDDTDDDDPFRGWLLKRGRINRAWKRRFFWLQGTSLKYALDQDAPPRGSLELRRTSTVVEAFHDDGSRRVDLGFALHARRRTCYLKSQDAWQQRAWVAILRCTINYVPSPDDLDDESSNRGGSS